MLKGHPRGLLVAFFANMGERFGFYTMMAILVLFLQARFGLSEEAAGNIYSWFYFGIYALAFHPGIGPSSVSRAAAPARPSRILAGPAGKASPGPAELAGRYPR